MNDDVDYEEDNDDDDDECVALYCIPGYDGMSGRLLRPSQERLLAIKGDPGDWFQGDGEEEKEEGEEEENNDEPINN